MKDIAEQRLLGSIETAQSRLAGRASSQDPRGHLVATLTGSSSELAGLLGTSSAADLASPADRLVPAVQGEVQIRVIHEQTVTLNAEQFAIWRQTPEGATYLAWDSVIRRLSSAFSAFLSHQIGGSPADTATAEQSSSPTAMTNDTTAMTNPPVPQGNHALAPQNESYAPQNQPDATSGHSSALEQVPPHGVPLTLAQAPADRKPTLTETTLRIPISRMWWDVENQLMRLVDNAGFDYDGGEEDGPWEVHYFGDANLDEVRMLAKRVIPESVQLVETGYRELSALVSPGMWLLLLDTASDSPYGRAIRKLVNQIQSEPAWIRWWQETGFDDMWVRQSHSTAPRVEYKVQRHNMVVRAAVDLSIMDVETPVRGQVREAAQMNLRIILDAVAHQLGRPHPWQMR